ncbi:MAG: NAD(P)H-dependent oxidoreductase [Syntrophobacterales bacterium]|nr:MAG: NAD(P)H-dependent oxidoreductase [Syntrophobacterales bacterium]
MSQILIIYYSRTGNTKAMAKAVEDGVRSEGLEVRCKEVKDVSVKELLEYEGIVIGSPTYYGTMAGEIKLLLDKSVKYHEKLAGKVGGAFSTSGVLGGGNETTVLDILKALLVHGMIIPGNPMGPHYGPVAIGKPDADDLN